MFLSDLQLVNTAWGKYGFLLPLADLGGQAHPIVADYSRLPNSPFMELPARPFDHLDPDYLIVNPEKGDPPIEELAADQYGTALCLSVLEHVTNPFAVFDGLYRCLKEGGLLILSTVFSYRYHEAPADYWRFSPECLFMLARKAGLKVLEYGWGERALLMQADEYNLVRGVYLVARK
jgi:SAM-dependent methyltransferase